MPNSLPTSLTFYPAYCFALSPTFNTWARLAAADVHALKERAGFEGQNLYFHLNHPIKWVRLVGVIVALDIYPNRWILSLDDNSGAGIEITCGRPKPVQSAAPPESTRILGFPDAPTEGLTATGRTIDLRGIDIGSVVKLKGGIGSFRGEKQITLERVSVVHTTNEEAAAWAENTEFRRSVLNVPWVISEEAEKKARRKAEGLDREKRARHERKRQRRIGFEMTKRSKHRGNGQLAADREEHIVEETNRASTEERMKEQAKERRARERRSREHEFEKFKAQIDRNKLESEETSRKTEHPTQEAQQAIAEVDKQREEDNLRLAAEFERRERVKSRRDEERRLREQEFERLKRRKEIGIEELGVIAR